jgi:hypothetical protein
MDTRGWIISASLFSLAAFFRAVTSADDGTLGWEPDRRLTVDPATSEISYNFKWSIAVGAGRSVHAVWYDSRDGLNQVYYKRSLDRGVTWEPDTRLSTAPGLREHPAIAVSGNNVYVVWHDTREGNLNVYCKRSSDRGATWGEDIKLSASGAAAHPSIAVWRHNAHVVWGDTRSGSAEIYTRHSTNDGATWDTEQLVSELPYESWVPTVAVFGQTVFVAWVDYRDANEEEYIRRSTDGGITWGTVTRLTDDTADSWAPSIAVRGADVYAVWFDRRDAGLSDADVEAKLDEAMALLDLPADPTPPRDPAVYYLPPFLQRLQDKVQAIQAAAPGWVQNGGDPLQLQALLQEFQSRLTVWSAGWSVYAKCSGDAGLTWGPDVRISSPNGPAARPSVALAHRKLHVVWFDGRHGQSEVYYRRSGDRGATWGPEVRLTDAPGDSLHPTVAAGHGAAVHVLWFDQRDGNSEIYYKRKRR